MSGERRDLDAARIIAASAARAVEERAFKPRWRPLPHQLPPPGDWYGWLLMAGRGAGKTDACAHYMTEHAKGPPCLHGPNPHWMAIIAPTQGDAATSCYYGPSGIRIHDPSTKLVTRAGGTEVHWPNGSVAKLFGAREPEDPERLRSGGNRCLVAKTSVRTEYGPRPIEQVQVGDRVWTRGGLRRVLHTWDNGIREVWRLTLSDGRTILATPDHLVPTQRGAVTLQHLVPGDTLDVWMNPAESTGMARRGAVERTATTGVASADFSTVPSGRRLTGRSPVVAGFITRTTTARITRSRIFSQSRLASTFASIWRMARGPGTVERGRLAGHAHDGQTSRVQIDRSTSPVVPLMSSVRSAGLTSEVEACKSLESAAPLDALSSWLAARVGPHERGNSGCARCVATHSTPQNVALLERALRPAGLWPPPVVDWSDTAQPRPESDDPASSAATSSTSTRTDRPALAQAHVVSVSPISERQHVYDLTIEYDHEFFANDVVVLQCLAWLEEVAAWRYLEDAWDMMRFGLRVGPRPHWIGSTTPKSRPLIKRLDSGEEAKNVLVTRASMYDNPHLPESIKEALESRYGGTTLGAQELYGRLIDQDENALFQREIIERTRVSEAPDLTRISVGVDPSGGAGEQGIVVVGKETRWITQMKMVNGRETQQRKKVLHGYVLADRTCHLAPDGWGRRAVQAAVDLEADDIVVEINFGGDMAVATVASAAEHMGIPIPIRTVRASRGKRPRAEPVSALMEQDRWHMVGVHEELEDQMCTWTEDLKFSPDRMDAMVWPAWHMKLVTTVSSSTGSFPGRQIAGRRLTLVPGQTA